MKKVYVGKSIFLKELEHSIRVRLHHEEVALFLFKGVKSNEELININQKMIFIYNQLKVCCNDKPFRILNNPYIDSVVKKIDDAVKKSIIFLKYAFLTDILIYEIKENLNEAESKALLGIDLDLKKDLIFSNLSEKDFFIILEDEDNKELQNKIYEILKRLLQEYK